jgi:hypothetical protein
MGSALKKFRTKKDRPSRTDNDSPTQAAATTSTSTNYARAPTDTGITTGQNRARGEQNASSNLTGPTASRGIDAPE